MPVTPPATQADVRPAAARPASVPSGPWDLFCRVIDNHGDLGVCWRLARGLADGDTPVRLWVDDPSALAWMAPAGHPGVEVLHWTEDAFERWAPVPGPVVIEAFGCDPPAGFIARMAAMDPAPVWLNLEYLSAEAYVARSHGLPSPQWSGPGRGLTKWFFYPGFTEATGGLLHGDGASLAAPTAWTGDRTTWAAALGLSLPPQALARPALAGQALAGPPQAVQAAHAAQTPAGQERLALVFAYPHLDWPGLLPALAAGGPVRLLVPEGGARQALAAHQAAHGLPAGLAWQALPWLPQPAFDRLLADCDLAIVRGEDSFARAQLAGDAPFLWQIYAQDDGAHAAKLEAWLALYLADAPAPLAAAVAGWHRALNRLAPWPGTAPDPAAWRAHQRQWRARLLAQTDLITRLRDFVASRPRAAPGT